MQAHGYDHPCIGAAFLNPRPNLNPVRTWDNIKVALNEWFDPTAFSLAPAGELGNAKCDFMVGPAFHNLDFSLLQDTTLREQVRIFLV
jgi:hypothetical protein